MSFPFVIPTTPPTPAKSVKVMMKDFYKKYKRYLWTASLAASYQTLKMGLPDIAPEIILGGIPIYTVQKQGHAASDEMLKYRAMGGVFLAHQKGGNRTFHFTARIFGPQRLIIVRILEQLQWGGREISQNIGDQVGTELDVKDVLTYAGDKDDLQAVGIPAAKSPNVITSYTSSYKGYLEKEFGYHKTIPIITDSKIYTNMYLETLVYREDVRLGLNCIEVRCAFRQYLPPTNINIMSDLYDPVLQESINQAIVINQLENSQNTILEDIPVEIHNKYYYQLFISEEELNDFKRNEMIINIMWASRTVINEYFINQNLGQIQRNNYGIELSTLAFLGAGYLAYVGLTS